MRYYGRRRYGKIVFFIICVFLSAVTLFLLIDARVRPFVRNTAVVQAQNYAATAAGSSVPQILKDEGADYSSFVEITRDSSGNIVSLQTDAMRINRIKSAINSSVAASLSGLDGKKLFAAAADVLKNPERCAAMAKASEELGVKNATERIYETVMALVK